MVLRNKNISLRLAMELRIVWGLGLSLSTTGEKKGGGASRVRKEDPTCSNDSMLTTAVILLLKVQMSTSQCDMQGWSDLGPWRKRLPSPFSFFFYSITPPLWSEHDRIDTCKSMSPHWVFINYNLLPQSEARHGCHSECDFGQQKTAEITKPSVFWLCILKLL